jgi:hypothetical protein
MPDRLKLCDDVELWIDRHKPTSVSALAVHPKKIEEIKFWFEQNVVGPDGKKVQKVCHI